MKDFAPYKESLELQKLGLEFVEGSPCLGYHNMVNHSGEYKFDYRIWEVTDNYIEAPLFSQAFRFLRDKYNLEYQIMKSVNGNYYVTIHKNTREYLDTIAGLSNACLDEVVDCYSYEEAELECLRKLIEIIKNGNQ
jgi:hypothetical protein